MAEPTPEPFWISKLLSYLPMVKTPWVKELEEWDRDSNAISILITGKTGTGKSTLINSIVGQDIAKVGSELDPQTLEVTEYSKQIDDVTVKIWDSPGLQDGTKNEREYRDDIKKKCNKVDLLVYCIQMSDTRCLPEGKDVNAMIKLTITLGPQIWKNAIVVLTFANDVIEMTSLNTDSEEEAHDQFVQDIDEWATLIHGYLRTKVGLGKELADCVPVVPAGVPEVPTLPDRYSTTKKSYWLSELWLKALKVTALKAQPALLRINIYRMQSTRDEYAGKEERSAEAVAASVPLMFKEKGASIGEEILAAVGSRVGPRTEQLAGRIGNSSGRLVGSEYGNLQALLLLIKLKRNFSVTLD